MNAILDFFSRDFIAGVLVGILAWLVYLARRQVPAGVHRVASTGTGSDVAAVAAPDSAVTPTRLRAAVLEAGFEMLRDIERGCIAVVADVIVVFSITSDGHLLLACARWRDRPVTLEDINEWNRDHVLSRVYLSAQQEPVIEFDMPVETGASALRLAAFMMSVAEQVDRFKRFIEERTLALITAPRPASCIDRAQVAAGIEAALDAQRADMRMRLDNPAHWRDTGHWVQRALGDAVNVLQPVPADGDMLAWLRDRRAKLAEVRGHFAREQDDPDGFGVATFHELERALETLIEGAGPRTH